MMARGIFIGIDERSGQYMIHGEGRVMCASTIPRKPNPNKFNKDDLATVAVTPWRLDVPKADEVIF